MINKPSKPVEEMTEEELFEFRNSFDPDEMGSDDEDGEGMIDDTDK